MAIKPQDAPNYNTSQQDRVGKISRNDQYSQHVTEEF